MIRIAILLAMATLIVGCSQTRAPSEPQQNLGGTAVEFKSADGNVLRGHLYGSGATGVILAHQFNGNQTGWTDFAMYLAAHGYQALTFDFSGFPESEGLAHVPDAPADLQAAVDFMRPRTTRIFIAGASMGSQAAIVVASRERFAGLILLSTPIEFQGLDVSDAIAKVKAPMLFVESADDPFVAGSSAILYKDARAPKAIHIFSGDAHGTEILLGPHGGELRAMMLQFIAAHSD
ncbi:MAG: alpha/beta fold hydrolase [Candidatus Binataceae bacterium]